MADEIPTTNRLLYRMMLSRHDPPQRFWLRASVVDALNDAFTAERTRDLVNYSLGEIISELCPSLDIPRGGVTFLLPADLTSVEPEAHDGRHLFHRHQRPKPWRPLP